MWYSGERIVLLTIDLYAHNSAKTGVKMKRILYDKKANYNFGSIDAGRKELKYIVNTAQLALLRSRLLSLTKRDTHAGEGGRYTIRSLYFDDDKNRCYEEVLNGISPREKFRIRIYNGSCDPAFLELKRKDNGLTQKRCIRLYRNEKEDFTTQPVPCLLPWFVPAQEDLNHPLFNQFRLQYRNNNLRPKVIVEYEREAFLYPVGNIRITFDTNICASGDLLHFTEEQIMTRPVMPVGQHILEVKYDEFLPDFIKELMELEDLRLTTFSKYFICRTNSRKVVCDGWF